MRKVTLSPDQRQCTALSAIPCYLCRSIFRTLRDAANVLFHVVNHRHLKKRPMIFTTNKPLSEWGKVLHDEDLAGAILDRVLERGRSSSSSMGPRAVRAISIWKRYGRLQQNGPEFPELMAQNLWNPQVPLARVRSDRPNRSVPRTCLGTGTRKHARIQWDHPWRAGWGRHGAQYAIVNFRTLAAGTPG